MIDLQEAIAAARRDELRREEIEAQFVNVAGAQVGASKGISYQAWR